MRRESKGRDSRRGPASRKTIRCRMAMAISGFRWPWTQDRTGQKRRRLQSKGTRRRVGSPVTIWMRRIRAFLKWAFISGSIVSLIGGVVLYRAYQEHIVENPGPHIAYDHIQSIIFQESPVFYEDGETPLGVLYAEEHREYIYYDELPEAWVDAITASEDHRYFEHPGVDARGISRAMWQNIRAGKVVAGGSTITQQTAKNLYYRPDRSFQSKWQEFQDALRLEAHFSKEQILEFYANQFHVNSNGRGIGIAARYFFDKDVSELTVLECAYIAGMVKSPSRYNPFIGRTEGSRSAAVSRASDRTHYVLSRMREVGSLDSAEYSRLLEEEIPFRKGTFQYGSNVLLDEVSKRLDLAPFPQLFEDLGIDNISTAGIQVTTSIDQTAQREATYSLWHHLSEVGPLLEGQGAEALRLSQDLAPENDAYNEPSVHQFRMGRVVESNAEGLEVDLGGHFCRVDLESLERMAQILLQADAGESRKEVSAEYVQELAQTLSPGTVLWLSVREWSEDSEQWLCDLELRPELQGAVVLLEEGKIRAMVGGNDNRHYNRAQAPRQLGSTWKPLIYMSAIEAGWSPAARLDNRHHTFYFETSWYYPRSAHRGEPFVSMSWAGTRSENLASVWLLAHLPDRMSSAVFKREAMRLGLAPASDESLDAEWISKIRDQLGVISTDRWLPELAFNAARLERVSTGTLSWEEELEVQSLFYGDYGGNFAKERARTRASGRSSRRSWALDTNFLRFRSEGESCTERVARLADLVPDLEDETEAVWFFPVFGPGGGWFPPVSLPEPDPAEFQGLFYRLNTVGTADVACGNVPLDWDPVDASFLSDVSDGRVDLPVNETNWMNTDEVDFWIDGRIRWSTILDLEALSGRHEVLLSESGRYDLDRLQYHPDFRTQLALHYVADRAHRSGVSGEMPLFLSMPLGAADVSLLEMVGVYQSMAETREGTLEGQGLSSTGSRLSVELAEEQKILITEIRDRTGKVLYRADGGRDGGPVEPGRLQAGRLTGDILRNVVKWGTGRRARSAVRIGDSVVPVSGKTGTTNDYRNAAFVGFIPKQFGGEWGWGDGYTLGVYVGYDDNRKMIRGRVRMDGASGALPVWIATAQGLADAGMLGAGQPVSPEMVIGTHSGLARVSVQRKSGLPELDPDQLAVGRKFDSNPETNSILVADSDPIFQEKEPLPSAEDLREELDDATEDAFPVRIGVQKEETDHPILP